MKQLLSAYCVPGTVLSALYMHDFNKFSRFVNEKTGPETLGNSNIDRTVIDTRVSLTQVPLEVPGVWMCRF